jgi:2-keto-3-deoxy-L-rhamnonate aldolase RhmA
MTNAGSVAFKERLVAKKPLIGTWLKTPSRTVAEVLSFSELDVLCVDTEHAPFDREKTDAVILACRAADMPVLVRARSASPAEILNALDSGATGVVIPHVQNTTEARSAAIAAHFGPGGRGYAGSTRAAGFTTKKMQAHLHDSAAATIVIAQIEDEEGANDAEGIAAVQGIDGLFIGWSDLMVVYGTTDPKDKRVQEAATHIAATATKACKAVGMFVPNVTLVPEWLKKGVTFFLLESDQVFLLKGAASLAGEFRQLLATPQKVAPPSR